MRKFKRYINRRVIKFLSEELSKKIGMSAQQIRAIAYEKAEKEADKEIKEIKKNIKNKSDKSPFGTISKNFDDLIEMMSTGVFEVLK